MNRIRISHPNRPPQFYSVGATLNPSANPDPNGTVLVTFPDGTETRYPDGTIFNVVVPAVVATPPPVQIAPPPPPPPAPLANNEQGGNGHVTVPVTTTGALENVPGTRKEESRGKIIAVLVALLLATLVGLGVYFLARGSNTPPAPPVATEKALPDCNSLIASCTLRDEWLFATAAEAKANCEKFIAVGNDCVH